MIRKKKPVRGKSSATPSLPPMPGPWALGFSALALALAVGASLSVRQTPLFCLMLFISEGLALAGAAWMRPEWGQGLELPRRSLPFQRWEAVFLLAYAVADGLLRFHGLGDLPPGAHGHEGEMAARLLRLAEEPYVGHVQDGDILWPTLSFYHGLAGIKFLGYSSMALRLPAAILAFCSLFVFYFLARRISSPGPADPGRASSTPGWSPEARSTA